MVVASDSRVHPRANGDNSKLSDPGLGFPQDVNRMRKVQGVMASVEIPPIVPGYRFEKYESVPLSAVVKLCVFPKAPHMCYA